MTNPTTVGPHGGAEPATNVDEWVLPHLSELLTSSPRVSFFLTAGAGSGKTWTLTRLLQRLTGSPIRPAPGEPPPAPLTEGEVALCKHLRRSRRSIGVITYTNVACDEVRARLGNNPLVSVQTIHSFCWSLIQGHDRDIGAWLTSRLDAELEALGQKEVEAQAKQEATAEGLRSAEEALRAVNNKTNQKAVESKRRALEKCIAGVQKVRTERESATLKREGIQAVPRFIYSPTTGRGNGRESLDHAQVVSTAVNLLQSKSTLRRTLAARYPILLIDECQDTDKEVLKALLSVAACDPSFTMGLIGDLRQRVYTSGAHDLDNQIPPEWARPALRLNRRSGPRIVRLINAIWGASVHDQGPPFQVPDQVAIATPNGESGVVRLFVGDTAHTDKLAAEAWLFQRMREVTNDTLWGTGGHLDTLTLVLEHALAAQRFGFSRVFAALRIHKPYAERLSDETPADLRVLDQVAHLRGTSRPDGSPAQDVLMDTILSSSPLLDADALRAQGVAQHAALRTARAGVRELWALWEGGADPLIGDVVKVLQATFLLALSRRLADWVSTDPPPVLETEAPEEQELATHALAIAALMKCRWSEWNSLRSYFDSAAGAETHQGVKGAEHSRVVAILDDAAASGSNFAYDRMFEVSELSDKDRENHAEGKDNTIDRTRRLLYVVCSRARSALAVVLWSENPAKARENALRLGWFEPDEIEEFPGA